jgi:hypothetical protein
LNVADKDFFKEILIRHSRACKFDKPSLHG